jgi:hypothetical protein
MMTVQLPMHMDKAAFLAWAEGRQERYELVEGRVVMMTRPRCAHAIIVGNLIVALRRRRSNRSRITRMNGARTTALNVAYHQADQQHRQMAPDKAPLCIAPSAHG